MTHRTAEQLDACLPHIRQAPKDEGTVALIVSRPAEDERQVLAEGRLDLDEGLVGDNWRQRPSSEMPEGLPHPDLQLTLMSTRVIEPVAVETDRWPLAGDQFFVDFDLSEANLPPGTRLTIGEAEIEVTAEPHLGCSKFRQRFGDAALRFVNCPTGVELNLRGVNAKVIRPGTVRPGDAIGKVATV